MATPDDTIASLLRQISSYTLPTRRASATTRTREILAEPGTMAVLVEGLGELKRGEIISLADLRREFDAVRPSFD